MISFLCCDLNPFDVLVTVIETKVGDYFLDDGVVGEMSSIELANFSYLSSVDLVGETNFTKYFVSTCHDGSFSRTWLQSGLYRKWRWDPDLCSEATTCMLLLWFLDKLTAALAGPECLFRQSIGCIGSRIDALLIRILHYAG